MKTMSAAGKGPSAAINDPVYNGRLDTSKEGSTGSSYGRHPWTSIKEAGKRDGKSHSLSPCD